MWQSRETLNETQAAQLVITLEGSQVKTLSRKYSFRIVAVQSLLLSGEENGSSVLLTENGRKCEYSSCWYNKYHFSSAMFLPLKE